MPPLIATALCATGVFGLFMFERGSERRTSFALWLPTAWMVLAISASKWLQNGERSAIEQIEGNALERYIYTVLLGIGLLVLMRRGRTLWPLLGRNWPILLFFCYGAASIVWSDYPVVALKRWIKALADLVMVLIVLTDMAPSAAIKKVVARVGFLLVPTSILLIRYYPALGRDYKLQSGRQVFVGVTNDKNMLGVLCLFVGLGVCSRILHEIRRHELPSYRPTIAHLVILLMVSWLFVKANSMTALSCFGLALVLVGATSIPAWSRRRAAIHTLVLALVTFAAVSLFVGFGADLVETLGRDATLTGRTKLWQEIVVMNDNPLLGTGFESFWMGTRLDRIWRNHWWHPNEAHNGYLEVFLNLGWIGVALLAVVILSGYRNAMRKLRADPEVGGLMLAYFVAGIVYSFTEAGFRLMNPVWIAFLLASTAGREASAERVEPLVLRPVPEWGQLSIHGNIAPRQGRYSKPTSLRPEWREDVAPK